VEDIRVGIEPDINALQRTPDIAAINLVENVLRASRIGVEIVELRPVVPLGQDRTRLQLPAEPKPYILPQQPRRSIGFLPPHLGILAVSFETTTEPGQEDPTVSPAQIHSAAMLTEMLRGRYGIPAGNCVTHAQVSVNPENMRVGFHTDWASSFPFAQLGLPDNYARPLPSMTVCGFEYDATFMEWAGTRLYAGVELAEYELARDAAASGVTVGELRKRLRKLNLPGSASTACSLRIGGYSRSSCMAVWPMRTKTNALNMSDGREGHLLAQCNHYSRTS
jgi:hypothetical protein